MRKTKAENSSETTRKIRPALSPETRENQLISLAMDLAEKQLVEGTASSQVISIFLKLGTTMAQLEKKKLEYDTELLKVKKESIESEQRSEEMYSKALEAFRNYNGQGEDDEY